MKYSKDDEIVILSLLILGNSFPATEHPFETDKNGNIIYEISPQRVESQNERGNRESEQNFNQPRPKLKPKPKPKPSQFGYYGKPLQQGYQSHFTLG